MDVAVKTVDTLGLAKRLQDASFSKEQAEALASAVRELEQNQLANLVTSKELDQKLAAQKLSLIIWFSGILFAQAAFIISIVKFV